MELFNSLKTGIERERKGKRVCLNQAVPYTLLCFPEQRSTVRAISEEREGKIYITESPAAAQAVSTFHRLADSRFKKDTFTRRKTIAGHFFFFRKEFATRARAGTASAHQDPEGITITIQN